MTRLRTTPATVAVRETPQDVVLRLSGALDAACLDDARGVLALLATAGRRPVVVDAHDVTFMDSAGVTVLDRVRRRCRAAGVPVTLLDPASAVTDVLELLGLTGLLPVVRTGTAPSSGGRGPWQRAQVCEVPRTRDRTDRRGRGTWTTNDSDGGTAPPRRDGGPR